MNTMHDFDYTRLENALRDEGFAGEITQDSTALDRVSYDESIFSVTPRLLITPAHTQDVQIAVRTINALRAENPELTLTPRAAASGLAGGSLSDSVIIDVIPHLNAIGSVTSHADAEVIALGPGAYFRDVEHALAQEDRYIPVFPASKDLCAIGGMVGNNCAGAESLTYGHFAEWVAALDVVLDDGEVYTIAPWSWEETQEVMAREDALGRITREIFTQIEAHEKEIHAAQPSTKKNTAGYALWDVVTPSVSELKAGTGTFDLTRLVSGSQGTLCVIVNALIRVLPLPEPRRLAVIPVTDLTEMGTTITTLLEADPFTLELFDARTVELAQAHTDFFESRVGAEKLDTFRELLNKNYPAGEVPAFTVLASFAEHVPEEKVEGALAALSGARRITDPDETEMFWQVRRASYSLSKLQSPDRRPAAFLEDMIVPPQKLPAFLSDITALFEKYDIEAAIHGHGGNGHLHFYPLLDFTDPATADTVLNMTDEFYDVAISHGGGICGEHNDGIIRTPFLDRMYDADILTHFEAVEHTFDQNDIFNPGKKVHPKYDLRSYLRTVN